MKILKFNENKEKKYSVEEYKDICTKMRNVLEIGTDDPVEILNVVKELKSKMNSVDKNILYFYHQENVNTIDSDIVKLGKSLNNINETIEHIETMTQIGWAEKNAITVILKNLYQSQLMISDLLNKLRGNDNQV